jgi:HsdM N-terminal domain/N-6 DNA Methylase
MKKQDLQMKFSIAANGEQGSILSTALDLSTLEAHLWEAANILRGPVDAADFKTYIFPLLFFKRISDVYDEEIATALAESGGDQEYALFPENHRFQIPEGCHWRDIRSLTTNIGQALQYAMREIEKANQRTLYGIFGDASWTNKDRLSDELLSDLVDHFSRLPLSNSDVDSDVLGQAYEYLIKKFADATNKKAGEFYTPRSIVRLMIRVLDPQEGESITLRNWGYAPRSRTSCSRSRWERQDTLGQTLWAGKEPNYLWYCPYKPLLARHRRFSDHPGRYIAPTSLLRGRPSRHFRLCHRQSTLFAGTLGRRSLDQ